MQTLNRHIVGVKSERVISQADQKFAQEKLRQSGCSVYNQYSKSSKDSQMININLNKTNKTNFKKIQIGLKYNKKIDYGIFNKYRLDEYFDVESNLLDGEVIPIVSVGSHALHLEQKFINFMERYNQFQLAFVGVYGPKSSGKSLFLDKILNLATFQGSHFTQPKIPKNKKQITLWSIPISRAKQKIFLVDCTGYEQQQQLSRQEQMLLDFLMFICCQITLVPSVEDSQTKVMSTCIQFLKASPKRMHLNNDSTSKDSFYWPSNVFLAYRSQHKPEDIPFRKLFLNIGSDRLVDIKDAQVNGEMQDQRLKQVSLMKYSDPNKKMLNGLYFQCISMYVNSIYQCSRSKFYREVRPNGNGISIVLMNFVLSLNCKDKVNVQSVVEESKKQILAQAYNCSVRWYEKKLGKQLNGQQPKSSNQE